MPLVVSNRARAFDALVAQAAKEARWADVLELRLDECSDVSEEHMRAAFASLAKPVIVAVNGAEAFGSFAGTLDQRLDCLQRATRAGARYVDIDAPNAAALGSVASACTRILSRHVAPALPATLFDELEAEARGGDLLKLVTHAASAEDGLALLVELARRTRGLEPESSRWIAFSSGDRGRFTRVLAPLLGSRFTYAAPTGGAATAPGQVRADELRQAWPAGVSAPWVCTPAWPTCSLRW